MSRQSKGCMLLAFIFILVVVSPIILTRPSFCSFFDFSNTGKIGDTIGGLTAPVIGLISIYFLIKTLHEQMAFNESQASLMKDEQFRNTLFQLLQNQREIAQSLSVSYHSLSKDSTKSITITLEGYKFFRVAKYELSVIFAAMDASYNCHYDSNEVSDWMNNVYNSLYTGMNVPVELQKENAENIDSVKKAALMAYTIDKYNITKEQHQMAIVDYCVVKYGLFLFF